MAALITPGELAARLELSHLGSVSRLSKTTATLRMERVEEDIRLDAAAGTFAADCR